MKKHLIIICWGMAILAICALIFNVMSSGDAEESSLPPPRGEVQNLPTPPVNYPKDSCDVGDNNAAARLTHFGQPLRLNGANLAWSVDESYARDIGDTAVNISVFRRRFAEIAAAGGNSARWWLHTNGTITPHITDRGVVTGLHSQYSNQEIIDQVRQVLDAAWTEGLVLNITLFSFDLGCVGNKPAQYDKMLNTHFQSYLDNALTPLVLGLKDHPALFAWEVFNESDGMAYGMSFFGDPKLYNCATGTEQPIWVLQRFINHAAARIHEIDPNVKVSTSVGHPQRLGDYSNAALTSQHFSVPHGVLDFYQLHWYSGSLSPFETSAKSLGLDRPVVVGEYAPSALSSAGKPSPVLYNQGYAGAWVWSQTSESRAKIAASIQNGKLCAAPINRKHVQACLKSKPASCYK